ncbi:serine/threonine-protein kinase [Actinomadura keratinilytica]|uniref:serine/threonine-protein kinase n=1 Tax=Actinomadura keratinilytica TaxID=547461 RepID=UPI00362059CE
MQPLAAHDPRSIGRYRLRARLGAGGMGRVYLGVSPGGRAVAVKVVHPELAADPQFRRRFAAEVQAARTVGGFHTTPVVDADPDADPPWLVTAYIAGPSLAEVLAEHGPLPEATVRRLGAGLAEALEAVHAAGLVHRDLKPSNILLADDGPRVIDFGIARALDATALTRPGAVSGTPGYLAPERLNDEPAGPPADVFALGVVLCHAAGVRPSATAPSRRCCTAPSTRSPCWTACRPPCATWWPRAWPRTPAAVPRPRSCSAACRTPRPGRRRRRGCPARCAPWSPSGSPPSRRPTPTGRAGSPDRPRSPPRRSRPLPRCRPSPNG